MRAMIFAALLLSPLTAGMAEAPFSGPQEPERKYQFWEFLPVSKWGAPCTIADDWQDGKCIEIKLQFRKGKS